MKRNIGLRNTPKSLIIKHDKKQKNDKRCEDELSSCNPCTDLLCDQCDLGTDHHPVSEKTQDGTDRTCGRCAVAPEESGYPYHGRYHFSDSYCCNIPVLRKRLPEGDPGTVSDTGIWYHRISG